MAGINSLDGVCPVGARTGRQRSCQSRPPPRLGATVTPISDLPWPARDTRPGVPSAQSPLVPHSSRGCGCLSCDGPVSVRFRCCGSDGRRCFSDTLLQYRSVIRPIGHIQRPADSQPRVAKGRNSLLESGRQCRRQLRCPAGHVVTQTVDAQTGHEYASRRILHPRDPQSVVQRERCPAVATGVQDGHRIRRGRQFDPERGFRSLAPFAPQLPRLPTASNRSVIVVQRAAQLGPLVRRQILAGPLRERPARRHRRTPTGRP